MFATKEELIKDLEKDKKVHITIPSFGEEEYNVSVQIDGFVFPYPTGEDIVVPQRIADLLNKKYVKSKAKFEKPKAIEL